MGLPPIRSLVGTVAGAREGGGGGREGEGVQDRASQSGAGHGIFPTGSLYAEFPPIWRIWPHAADFGIWRRGRDSPVSPFPQNFPTPELAPSPQLDRAGFAETA